MVLPESGVRRWEGVPRRTTAAEPESSLAPTFHKEAVMSWRYQIRKRGDGRGFDIVESYPDLEVWTKSSIAPHGETKQGLILCLSRMLNDALRHPVITEKGKRHGK